MEKQIKSRKQIFFVFQMYISTYRSPKANNQFTKLPYRIPKTDFCTYYDTLYRQYIYYAPIKTTSF